MAQHFAPGMIKQHFRFGSSTRGTILPRAMDEQSDVDYMIVFNDSNATPQTYLSRLRTFVEKRYRSSEIYQSNPTNVLELNHIKFDLVPASSTWLSGLRIPSGPDRWMSTDPKDFNGVLEAKNKANKSLIKPTIRLFKYWNAASGYPFESFAIEKCVCDLSFWWQSNQKDYFFAAVDSLSTSWSQSQRVNDEISLAKKIIANVRQFEKRDMHVKAETEIRKLFRL
jgi:hypothetical protein